MVIVISHIHHLYHNDIDRLDDILAAKISLDKGLPVYVENVEFNPKKIENNYTVCKLLSGNIKGLYSHLRDTIEDLYNKYSKNDKPPKVSLIDPPNISLDSLLYENASKINRELQRYIDGIKIIINHHDVFGCSTYKIVMDKEKIRNYGISEIVKYIFSAHTAMMYILFRETEEALHNFIENNPNSIIICGYNHLHGIKAKRYDISITKLDPSGEILLEAYRRDMQPVEIFIECLENIPPSIYNENIILQFFMREYIEDLLREKIKSGLIAAFIIEGLYSYEGKLDPVVKDVLNNKDIRYANKLLREEYSISFLDYWKKRYINKLYKSTIKQLLRF